MSICSSFCGEYLTDNSTLIESEEVPELTVPEPESGTQTVPLTIICGFLGAGKTSIILSLLPRLPKDYKVVLLKNEFGDVEGSTWISLCTQRLTAPSIS